MTLLKQHTQRSHKEQHSAWMLFHIVSAAIAVGKRPVPFRTRKLSPPAPMVLHSNRCGRVGHRRAQHSSNAPHPSRCGALLHSRACSLGLGPTSFWPAPFCKRYSPLMNLFMRWSSSFAADYLALSSDEMALSSDEMIVACRLVLQLRPHLDSARRVISRTAFLRYSD